MAGEPLSTQNPGSQQPHHKIVIDNVRIFNGHSLSPMRTVVIDGNVIGTDPSGAIEHVDGQGGVLLPGLIESHTHPRNINDLQELTRFGVTTAFVMACFSPEHGPSLQGLDGLVDIHYSSIPAAAPDSRHGQLIIRVNPNPNLLVHGPDDAARWVEEQLTWNPDFFKLIAQTPGLSQETLDALVREIHRRGKKAICHASDLESQRQAMLAGVDQIHHISADHIVDDDLVRQVLQGKQICAPTLSILKCLSEGQGPPGLVRDFTAARESVRLYHQAKIPILAGSDSNNEIVYVPFGKTMHTELDLLVEAGLSPLEALQSATSLPAQHWGLEDRGMIAPGKRADLLLIEGDPITDITATRNIRRVWVAGQEYSAALGSFAI